MFGITQLKDIATHRDKGIQQMARLLDYWLLWVRFHLSAC